MANLEALHIDQTKTRFDLALVPDLEAQPCTTTMGVRCGEQGLVLGQTHPERSACRAAVDRSELITRKFDFNLAASSLWSFNY